MFSFFKFAASILIVVLVVLIVFFGVQLYNTYNSLKDEQIEVAETTKPEPVDETVISPEIQKTEDEFRDSFWVSDDDLETYRITKTKAEEVYARNNGKPNLTQVELNDEMLIMTNYAAAARNVYPEEGLRVFAQIYNDERYSGRVRANALLHAMFYPIEKLGTEELTIQNANEWIFAPQLLSSVLEGSKYEGKYLENNRSVFEASLIGLTKAASISDSDSLSAKINSLRLEARLNLAAEDLLKAKNITAWKHLNIATWSREDTSVIRSMLFDYAKLQQQILDGFNIRGEYNDEYVHAAKNVLHSYTTMQALGIDTQSSLTALNTASNEYAQTHRQGAPSELVQKIDAYSGVNALYMTCSYIIENEYALEEPADINEAVQLAEPFLKLSLSDLRIFLVTAALGERESGACFKPFVVLGQKSDAFRTALIEGVGGWHEGQFE